MALQKNHEIITPDKIACKDFCQQQTNGILISMYPVTIHFNSISTDIADKNWHTPSAIIYSSDDGLPASSGNNTNNHYTQHSTTRSDSYGIKETAAHYMYESFHMPQWENWEQWLDDNKKGVSCSVTAVRYQQYILVRLENNGIIVSSTTTLPDNFLDKDMYLSLTCENGELSDFNLRREDDAIEDGTITPVKFRKSTLSNAVGDIPNTDCPGWWTAHSDGITVSDKPVTVTYDTISYHQAAENWHTPLIVVYSALDRLVNGIAYNEFCVIRSDGFGWKTNADDFTCEYNTSDSWQNWSSWLSDNKSGIPDCTITATYDDNILTLINKNNGVTVSAQVRIPLTNTLPLCISISGELCSISNIRISEK